MMIKEVIVFAAAFGLCAALGSTSTGCDAKKVAECETPNRPPALSGLHFGWVVVDKDAGRTIDPVGGTLASTGDTIVLRYREDNTMFEVVYAIDGPWSFDPHDAAAQAADF
jgi:hypothetical protein